MHSEGVLTEFLTHHEIDYALVPLSGYVGSATGVCSHVRTVARTLPKLTSYLKRAGVALVHTNDMRMNLTWCVPARLSGVPQLWHQRVPSTQSRLDRMMLNFAAEVVCISQFTRDSLQHERKAGARVIDNPFDTRQPAPNRITVRKKLIEELRCPTDTRIIAYCGNFMERKRPVEFVDVVARARDICGDTPVMGVMFGEARGEYDELVLRRAALHNLADNIHLLGFRHATEQLLAGADVVLAIAVDEPFGRVPVEAMLAGTPVVAAASGGHLETIKDGVTGLLVNADDFDGMAAALCRILNDAKFASELADAARREAVNRYSLDSHAREIASVYDRLIHD